MIFLSHNHRDKPLVEPIAEALAEKFGQDQVFYDSWSIQPGEGIIARMNDGLTDSSIFVFFISDAALNSGMVSLEWQNALMAAARGKLRFVPVRLDRSPLPAVLQQIRYIDLYTNGLPSALRELEAAASGENAFVSSDQPFQNLSVKLTRNGSTELLTVSALRHVESFLRLFVLLENEQGDVDVNAPAEGAFHAGYFPGLAHVDGRPLAGFLVQPTRALTPDFPLTIHVTPLKDVPIRFAGLGRSEGVGKQVSVIPVEDQR